MIYYDIPILYIPFKRLNIVKDVFSQIKAIKPYKLYIAQDGARDDKEKEELEKVLDFIKENVDWDCKLNLFKSDKNYGPNLFIYKSINWLFEKEDMGVILEEDGFPSLSFFGFSKKLLEKYKDDKSIYAVCGFSACADENEVNCDYTISNITFYSWAFATWKNRWFKFEDFELKNITSYEFLNRVYKNKQMRDIVLSYANILTQNLHQFKDKITWDLKFRFVIQYNGGCCVFPRQNLIKHLDFDSEYATSFHVDTWLGDISKYIDIKEYDFNALIPCKDDSALIKHCYEFLEKDILFSFISDKVYNRIYKILKNYDSIYIYGAGFFGYIFYNVYMELLKEKLVAFVDDNAGGKLLEKDIIPLSEARKDIPIFIAVTRVDQIRNIKDKLKSHRAGVIISKDLIKEVLS
ncbi:hypothetical protein HY04AAS1_1607 [Hydrogenobaculum sp. Y04AAS1]|uniref:hypothetical protein n=1 Tax=Hydrogenobaculum sp. (strain Y04AAS1) TaxID=380749 RepID=UPI00015BCB26|nr:hypothetical protein HY04AAS1_1607 [Hydrogenobaculum sp. Y04AAS1]HCT67115.1 hypothetical protein [Hydrogenobaculum sp.]